MQTRIVVFLFASPSLVPLLSHSIPLAQPVPLFTYLEIPLLLLVVRTHPLLSLVSYQLFSPYCLAHPEGTPQIKLHIYIDNINNISRPV
jgi:hypothetical protein